MTVNSTLVARMTLRQYCDRFNLEPQECFKELSAKKVDIMLEHEILTMDSVVAVRQLMDDDLETAPETFASLDLELYFD